MNNDKTVIQNEVFVVFIKLLSWKLKNTKNNLRIVDIPKKFILDTCCFRLLYVKHWR
jgi:hypothetical protein